MLTDIEIFPGTKQRKVRLRHCKFVELSGSLRLNDGSAAQQMHQRLISAIDRGLMPGPDRSHYDDLAPDELDTFGGRQNTGFGHSPVLIHGEKAFVDF